MAKVYAYAYIQPNETINKNTYQFVLILLLFRTICPQHTYTVIIAIVAHLNAIL